MSATLAAEILSTSRAALARLAAERVVAALPDPSRYGDDPLQLWHGHMLGRLGDLELALGDGRPRLFADQVGWAKVAFGARGVPDEDLVTSLRCLRDVLASELPAGAAESSSACVDEVLASWDRLGRGEDAVLSASSPRGALATRYVVALLEGDRRTACRLVLDAVEAGAVSVRDALLEVCLPAQRELGRMWHLDEITVAEEHFISSTTARLVAQLVAQAEPAPAHGRTVVAACLEGDDHDLGLAAVTELFELDGWRVVFLGRNVPLEDLVWSASTFSADLVLLSATLPSHVRSVGEAVTRLARAEPAVPVVVGGPAFEQDEELAARTGAAALGRHAEQALGIARRIVGLAGRPER